MARFTIRLDHGGIEDMLKSAEVAAVVHNLAEAVAANVDAGDAPVVVNDYVTDRTASSVTIAHPSGLARQAKHGALTRAAAAEGLEVRDRG